MFRSIFFASGLFVTLWGISLLFVDKLVLKTPGETTAAAAENVAEQVDQRTNIRARVGPASQTTAVPAEEPVAEPKIVDPPDWAAFSLMSLGTVTMLYAIALPKKQS
ncbi:MAG: hypothetical protein KY476_00355 [Planctomycetes bacterium]|nr:hypothetical protein [Planctomycetota bacterium]